MNAFNDAATKQHLQCLAQCIVGQLWPYAPSSAFWFGATLFLCELLAANLNSIFSEGNEDIQRIRHMIMKPHRWAIRRSLNKPKRFLYFDLQ